MDSRSLNRLPYAQKSEETGKVWPFPGGGYVDVFPDYSVDPQLMQLPPLIVQQPPDILCNCWRNFRGPLLQVPEGLSSG